jgi:hypothetical protein
VELEIVPPDANLLQLLPDQPIQIEFCGYGVHKA